MTEVGAWRIVRNRLTSPGPTGAAAYTSDRVHPVVLPKDAMLPAVTYQVITAPREHAFGTRNEGTVHARVQFDIYASSYLGTASGRKRIADALDRFAGTASGVVVHDVFIENERETFVDQLEDGRRTVWRRSIDYMVHYEE